jgi:hypothetical protein
MTLEYYEDENVREYQIRQENLYISITRYKSAAKPDTIMINRLDGGPMIFKGQIPKPR